MQSASAVASVAKLCFPKSNFWKRLKGQQGMTKTRQCGFERVARIGNHGVSSSLWLPINQSASGNPGWVCGLTAVSYMTKTNKQSKIQWNLRSDFASWHLNTDSIFSVCEYLLQYPRTRHLSYRQEVKVIPLQNSGCKLAIHFHNQHQQIEVFWSHHFAKGTANWELRKPSY